ncbi:GNAT family N-acetyltransferase [Sulfuriferula sp. GW1]|uniref:aldose epimerase family protein n=1 Tax=Sulfuriferula sp. GW1 TaxID=3345111 RepID=UPI0039B02166
MILHVETVSWAQQSATLASLRRTVFIEEQGVPEALEWDGLDAAATHFIALASGSAVGCARLLADGHIGRMAVLPAWRGKGAGRALLNAVLHAARQKHLGWLYLNAQTHAAGFYARFGFQPVGAEFPDADIPHLRMELVMPQHTDTLNQQFAIAGKLEFVDAAAGLPVVKITTPHASARIAVQGAQVLEWQPSGQLPVLWVSRAAVYQPGKGVRGGVPVCWPWFGAGEAGKPAHGFVRTRMWEVRETGQGMADSIFIRFGMKDDESTRALWDYAFDLELIVTVGAALKMELVTRNKGATAFEISEGLHTYFHVGNIHQTQVLGLENTVYLDKVRDFARDTQTGAVRFSGETDRVYIDTLTDCVIDDAKLNRKIRVAKAGSTSTVVWNPWAEKEKGFADMAAGEYQEMLCVETVNAGDARVTVAADTSHSMVAFIGLETGG